MGANRSVEDWDEWTAKVKEKGYNGNGHGASLHIETLRLEQEDWGRFHDSIKLWEEITGRNAPTPTIIDPKSNERKLSSLFTEWLMGLPEGWITDAGLTRNEELKACGNGVVPQQAAMALKILLKDLPPLTEKNRNEHRSN